MRLLTWLAWAVLIIIGLSTLGLSGMVLLAIIGACVGIIWATMEA